MDQANPHQDVPQDGQHGPMQPDAKAPAPKELSRLERLKLKIKKLQGKNPDIYPMF